MKALNLGAIIFITKNHFKQRKINSFPIPFTDEVIK